MAFQPQVGQELAIEQATYQFAEHPAVPGIPYGQEGRQAIVYKLVASDGEVQALKVFKPRYRLPEMVSLTEGIAPLAGLAGLQVCQRTVLTPRRHTALLRQYLDLTYAVLMPWVEGPTWMQVMLERRALAPEESLSLARYLADVLAGMEQRRLAHCDLSGPNVLLPGLPLSPELGRGGRLQAVVGDKGLVALVDVEQLYGPGLNQPGLLPGGSPGYAHRTAPEGLWSAVADRFAGAVLLAEMLGWCDERVREVTWGENYFEPAQVHQESERYRVLSEALRDRWDIGVGQLFERAWRSETLADCATFGEWLVTLPEEVPVTKAPPVDICPGETAAGVRQDAQDTLRVLMDLARRLEEQENLDGALEAYRQAQALAPSGSGLAEELTLIVQDVKDKRARMASGISHPTTEGEERTTVQEAETLEKEGQVSPLPVTGLDQLFDDGLVAYQQEAWLKAGELLGAVVCQQPSFERHGWRAKKLLSDVEKRLVPTWKKALRYSARIALSSALVLALVCAAFGVLYLTLVRPIVEDTIFTMMRPTLHALIEAGQNSGCLDITEKEINDTLYATVPEVVTANKLTVQLHEGVIGVSGKIANHPIWIEANPQVDMMSKGFRLQDLRINWLLKLLFSPQGLRTFIEEYVDEGILRSGNIILLSLSIQEGSMTVCVY